MNEEMHRRHEQEREEYLKQYTKTRIQLEVDEALIREQFEMSDEGLPRAWRDKVDRDRQKWIDEWGVKGWRQTQMKERHTKDRDEETARFRERMDDPQNLKQAEYEALRQTGGKRAANTMRDSLYENLLREHDAIRSFYEDRAGQPVPETVTNQLEKDKARFMQEWAGINPGRPLDTWRVNHLRDSAEKFKSWRDLLESHEVIEKMYGGEAFVPDATKRRMDDAILGYHSEVDGHRKMQKSEWNLGLEKLQPEQLSERERFKEQLAERRANRERPQQRDAH